MRIVASAFGFALASSMAALSASTVLTVTAAGRPVTERGKAVSKAKARIQKSEARNKFRIRITVLPKHGRYVVLNFLVFRIRYTFGFRYSVFVYVLRTSD